MVSTAAYNLWDNHHYSIANFQLQLNINTLQQLNILSRKQPKINALKQYYVCKKELFTSACVAVMWRIPPPNSSPSFEMSAIFLAHENSWHFLNAKPGAVFSLEIYSIVYGIDVISGEQLVTF